MKEPLFDESLDQYSFDKSCLPVEATARVQAELRHGERLVWVGQPQTSHFLRQSLPLVLFGVVWTAMSSVILVAMILGKASGIGHGGNMPRWMGILMPLAFVLIGLGFLSAPYWYLRKAKHTCYALTNRRAILWEARGLRDTEVRTYQADDLIRMFRVEYPGGGDLVFECLKGFEMTSNPMFRVAYKHGFLGIKNVWEVEELVRSTLLSPKG